MMMCYDMIWYKSFEPNGAVAAADGMPYYTFWTLHITHIVHVNVNVYHGNMNEGRKEEGIHFA